MRKSWLLLVAVIAIPLTSSADALFGNKMAGDQALPKAWGIGVDYFNMRQPYALDNLVLIDTGVVDVDLGQLLLPDPGILPIDNEIRHTDLKLDVWVTPFLNIFGIYGRIDGDTKIDLGVLGLPLPPQTNALTIDYDGEVFGGGSCSRPVAIDGSLRSRALSPTLISAGISIHRSRRRSISRASACASATTPSSGLVATSWMLKKSTADPSISIWGSWVLSCRRRSTALMWPSMSTFRRRRTLTGASAPI